MNKADMIRFARSELERIDGLYGGPAYRRAATLNDELHLPCVLLASIESVMESRDVMPWEKVLIKFTCDLTGMYLHCNHENKNNSNR